MLRATGDIDAVSKVLGHASLNTTRLYTAKDRTRLTETIEKISHDLVSEEDQPWPPTDDLIRWLERL